MQCTQEDIPPGVSVASIRDAVATLRCGNEWEAKLTLVPAPPSAPSNTAELAAPAKVSTPPHACLALIMRITLSRHCGWNGV